ncbi:MAG TPA: hypothetical protein VF546_07965 [Pyrinomonadaceae bacterium]|jgi:uncharacterized protein YoxC
MSTRDPAFWVLVIVAAAFVVVAAAMVGIAVVVARVARTVRRLEERAEPLLAQVTALSARVNQIAAEGRGVAEQVTTISDHLSTATQHFSESAALIKDEVRELKQIVGYTATNVRDRVESVGQTIARAERQFSATTLFIHTKLIEPARELAAIMAGFRRGLEVLTAPRPKQLDQTYSEEEMFIG